MSDRGTALARVRELETANTKLEEQVARLTAALDSSRADAPHELVESAAGGPVAVRDVTAVEGSRLALEASELRFRRLFESAAVGIMIVDEHRFTLDANQGIATMQGVSIDDVKGKRLSAFERDREQRGHIGEFDDLVARTRDTSEVERELVHSDGSSVWVLTTTSPVRDADGNFLYALRILQDITARKRAEEDLAEREERFRRLFDHSPIGVALSGIGRHVQWSNPALQQMLGKPAEEVDGANLVDLRHPDYEQPETGSHDKLVSRSVDTLQYERVLQHADGRPSTRASPPPASATLTAWSAISSA